jgi:hypothetical protein
MMLDHAGKGVLDRAVCRPLTRNRRLVDTSSDT